MNQAKSIQRRWFNKTFFLISDISIFLYLSGTLSVNGDPSEDLGDITLRLQEKGAAVGIVPGSKNLTLLRALDREEKIGPSNVYVNVRCDRRRTTDPVRFSELISVLLEQMGLGVEDDSISYTGTTAV